MCWGIIWIFKQMFKQFRETPRPHMSSPLWSGWFLGVKLGVRLGLGLNALLVLRRADFCSYFTERMCLDHLNWCRLLVVALNTTVCIYIATCDTHPCNYSQSTDSVILGYWRRCHGYEPRLTVNDPQIIWWIKWNAWCEAKMLVVIVACVDIVNTGAAAVW